MQRRLKVLLAEMAQEWQRIAEEAMDAISYTFGVPRQTTGD
jgi:hypothetical protein